MCFSATASFTAGGALAAAGAATLSTVRSPRALLLAGIPLLFAAQQISEGFVWLELEHGRSETAPMYIFLAFAQVVWPVWMPLSVRLYAGPGHGSRWLDATVVLGAATAVTLASWLLWHGAISSVRAHHISYRFDVPRSLEIALGITYGFATVMPPLLSGMPRVPVLGIATAVSYVLTAVLFEHATISTWCYFAAVLSVIVYWVLANEPRESVADAFGLQVVSPVTR